MDIQNVAERFHRDGFAIVRQVLSGREIEEVARHVDDYCQNIVPNLEPGDVYYEDSPARPIKSAFFLEQRSALFERLRHDERLIGMLRAIWPKGEIIPEIVMFFAKPARDGSEAPPHQDNAFQCWDPALVLTVTIAIDESTPDNGALMCQTGSHRLGLLPYRLFVVANIARRWKVNPEEALRKSNAKFARRFAHVESQLDERGLSVYDATLEEMEDLYQQGKQREAE